MIRRQGLLLIAICLSAFSNSQTDSVLFDGVSKLPDGIFIKHDDLRRNNIIGKNKVVSSFDKDQLEFFGKVMFEESFTYTLGDSIITRPTREAWGYVQNNTFYVNYKGEFYRIPVFGAISYLVANVRVFVTGAYDPRFGYTGGGSNNEVREFLINYYDGSMLEFSSDYFETLLSSDPGLLEEYRKLSKRQRKEQVYAFIRKFNLAHPIYFLK